MANNLQTHSVEPLPRSATSETKEKFEYFLKTALQKSTPGKNAHQRKIDNESHESDEEENLGNTDEKENREFILNKFFEYDANTRGEKGKPVPKPRTKKQTIQAENSKLPSIPSNETFKVTSPKVVLGQDFVQKISSDEDNSKKRSRNLSPVSSTGTFKISSPKILKPIDLSSEKHMKSQKRDSKIGDIIIHKKSSSRRMFLKL
ncbi:hypothetical protein HHI36_005929 [Cryptolaemus montrouzieri]|uniref:Uncharacterized protein n=1 Tax=Cryptolaemus montrouzieri TaxID=559131 RepID=A0ABD2NWK8_9CUCU